MLKYKITLQQSCVRVSFYFENISNWHLYFYLFIHSLFITSHALKTIKINPHVKIQDNITAVLCMSWLLFWNYSLSHLSLCVRFLLRLALCNLSVWTSSCSLQITPESVRRASSAPPLWSSPSMLRLRPRTLRRRSASEASWTWAPSPSPTTRLWTSLWISSGSWGCASVWLHTTGENKHVTAFLSVLICSVYYCRGRKAPESVCGISLWRSAKDNKRKMKTGRQTGGTTKT